MTTAGSADGRASFMPNKMMPHLLAFAMTSGPPGTNASAAIPSPRTPPILVVCTLLARIQTNCPCLYLAGAPLAKRAQK